MDQPRSARGQQPHDTPQPAPVPQDGPREPRGRALAEKAGLVALGQVIGYLLRRLFD